MQSAAADLEQATEVRLSRQISLGLLFSFKDMAETFFIGSKTEDEVNAFERSFIEDRKRAHELKIKAEKFHELLQMSKSTSYLNSNHHHYRS